MTDRTDSEKAFQASEAAGKTEAGKTPAKPEKTDLAQAVEDDPNMKDPRYRIEAAAGQAHLEAVARAADEEKQKADDLAKARAAKKK